MVSVLAATVSVLAALAEVLMATFKVQGATVRVPGHGHGSSGHGQSSLALVSFSTFFFSLGLRFAAAQRQGSATVKALAATVYFTPCGRRFA